MNASGKLSNRMVEWESRDVRNFVFRPPWMLVIGSAAIEIRDIATGKLAQLWPVPGHVQLSWQGRSSEGNPSNLGVHVVMGEGTDATAAVNQWYSLDKHRPYALFRLRRR